MVCQLGYVTGTTTGSPNGGMHPFDIAGGMNQ